MCVIKFQLVNIMSRFTLKIILWVTATRDCLDVSLIPLSRPWKWRTPISWVTTR